jgi:hypothetical protein
MAKAVTTGLSAVLLRGASLSTGGTIATAPSSGACSARAKGTRIPTMRVESKRNRNKFAGETLVIGMLERLPKGGKIDVQFWLSEISTALLGLFWETKARIKCREETILLGKL